MRKAMSEPHKTVSSQPLRPEPQPGLTQLAPYVPGRAKAAHLAKSYKLSANETPLGASPSAIEAFKASADRLADYPEGSARALREAIARQFGLAADRIVCGNGSDDLLHLLAQAYLGEGTEAIVSAHGFLVYSIVATAAGADVVTVAEPERVTDVDAILAAQTERTRMVFIANPNNPTGTYLPFDEVRRLHRGLRPDVLLVLDAAYAEYVGRNDYSAGIELAGECANVVMTRTFSKIYGLAALRVGWLYGPENVVDILNRIRGPFNVSIPAMMAGVAAMEDRAHIEAARAHNDQWLPWLTREIEDLGLSVLPSVANFIMIEFPDRPGFTAAEADEFLVERGLILRQLSAYGLPNALRLTVGPEEANRLVVEALKAFMSNHRQVRP